MVKINHIWIAISVTIGDKRFVSKNRFPLIERADEKGETKGSIFDGSRDSSNDPIVKFFDRISEKLTRIAMQGEIVVLTKAFARRMEFNDLFNIHFFSIN